MMERAALYKRQSRKGKAVERKRRRVNEASPFSFLILIFLCKNEFIEAISG